MSTAQARARTGVEQVAESATDVVDLFGETVERLRAVLPLDGWCGHTLDPATAMPTGGDARFGFAPELVPRLLEIEYRVGDVNPFDELLRRPAPVGVLHQATEGDPERSPRYREVMTASGYEDELRLVLRHQGRPWGALVLLRGDDAPRFTGAEAELLATLSGTLATAVKRLLLRGYVEAGGLPQHPGLVVLEADGTPGTVTPEAERWLAALADHEGAVPLSVLALASQAAERGGPAVRSRTRTRTGSWVTLTAWALGERVAVSLEGSAPHDLTALALEAYSLSARERQVVELVLLGYSTGQIGERLFLSPYTVQDHLKAIFDKTGLRSRRELAADLFFRHYLPRMERGALLSSDGWFAE